MIPTRHWNTLNGLDFEAGVEAIAICVMCENSGEPYVELAVSSMTRRLSAPLLGGTCGPAIDTTFCQARLYVWGVRVRGWS